MVIIVGNSIIDGIDYFHEGNYKKALSCFQNVEKDDVHYDEALKCQTFCFIRLEQYKKALEIINPLISKHPYDDLLWCNKIHCHIFLNENDKALKYLGELERLIDEKDISDIVMVANLYNMLNEYDKALIYSDKALAIDESYIKAIYQKIFAVMGKDDDVMLNEATDLLLKHSGNNFMNRVPAFLIKLFSKEYRQALDIVENCNHEAFELLKSAIYVRMCDDLSVNVVTAEKCEISVDEALEILFDYVESGKTSGTIGEVKYFIK